MTISISGTHGTGKTQVLELVTKDLRDQVGSERVIQVPSASSEGWKDYYKALYPGESYENWQTRPKWDQEVFQLYCMSHSTSTLLEYNDDDRYVIMDRSVYDIHAYSLAKDMDPRITALSEDLFLKASSHVHLYCLLLPDPDYEVDYKASRAWFDRDEVNHHFLSLIPKVKQSQFFIVPNGTLKEKAKAIVKTIRGIDV